MLDYLSLVADCSSEERMLSETAWEFAADRAAGLGLPVTLPPDGRPIRANGW